MVAANSRKPNMNADGTDFLERSANPCPNAFEHRDSWSPRPFGDSPGLLSGNSRYLAATIEDTIWASSDHDDFQTQFKE